MFAPYTPKESGRGHPSHNMSATARSAAGPQCLLCHHYFFKPKSIQDLATSLPSITNLATLLLPNLHCASLLSLLSGRALGVGSDVLHVEGPHQEVQVAHAGGVDQLGALHHGQGDAERRPDVGGHDGLTGSRALPLLLQGGQEVTGRLPAGVGQGQRA